MPILPTFGIESLEPEIAGSEIELLVIERIVGDVHLAIDAGQPAVFLEDGGGVVIDPGRAPLEQGSDE